MIAQIAIAITGVFAVWLSQDARADRRKYACLFGLAGQPFWLYVSYDSQQWGVFFLSIVYMIGWMRGIKIYWLDKSTAAARRS